MKKGDKIVVLIIFIVIIASYFGVNIYKQNIKSENHIAVIEQNGEVIERIDLDEVKEEKEWKIYEGDEHYNTVKVEPHRIRFTDANCPDLVCVKAGWISQAGEISVCLPHKLLIRIEGKEDEIDGVAY
jgi:hypothetical protein